MAVGTKKPLLRQFNESASVLRFIQVCPIRFERRYHDLLRYGVCMMRATSQYNAADIDNTVLQFHSSLVKGSNHVLKTRVHEQPRGVNHVMRHIVGIEINT